MPLPFRRRWLSRRSLTIIIAAGASVLAVCLALVFTFAVNRSFNVLDYGAKGDGVTDDAGAIQAAVDAAAADGGTLTFPAGTFVVGSPVSLQTGVTLQGIPGQTVLAMPPQSSQTFILDGSDLSDVRVFGLTLRSTGYVANVSGLYLVGGQDCRASQLRLEGLWYGMKLGSGTIARGWRVSDIVARDCLDPLYVSHVHDSSFGALDLQAVKVESNQYHAVYLERECRGLKFTDCIFSGGSGYTLHLWLEGGSSSGLIFENLTLDARAGRYPLVIGGDWSDVTFLNSVLIANSDGAVTQFYGASNITFDRFQASGGEVLTGPDYGEPRGIVFRNGVYEGSELGAGATFENVTLGQPGEGSTTTAAASR